MTVLKSLRNSASHRPEALTDAEYDHEIQLIDHSTSPRSASSPASSNAVSELAREPTPNSRTPLRQSESLRKEVGHRNASKYRKGIEDQASGRRQRSTEGKPPGVEGPLVIPAARAVNEGFRTSPPSDGHDAVDDEDRGRRRSRSYGSTDLRRTQERRGDGVESHIDILYENQRGCFFCGMPLFSARALGNLDPAPWTNEFHKPSATGIENAQVPNPSWHWSWKEWKVNHDDGDDPEGYQYSFMFSNTFSWHGPSWWNSFVRRRAWIRKRVKAHGTCHVPRSHMFNDEYFTIHPKRSVSRSSRGSYSILALAKQQMAQEAEKEDILSMAQLMDVLKDCRIDRERYEAVKSFVQHGGADLAYLRDRMHAIMAQFIFQVSRRTLLAHLLQTCAEATARRHEHRARGTAEADDEKRRIDDLEAAIQHAEEEVRRLEFWSDVKRVVEGGEGLAAGAGHPWHAWEGLDRSGPRDVITERERGQEMGLAPEDDARPRVSWSSGVDKGKKTLAPEGLDDGCSASMSKGKGTPASG